MIRRPSQDPDLLNFDEWMHEHAHPIHRSDLIRDAKLDEIAARRDDDPHALSIALARLRRLEAAK